MSDIQITEYRTYLWRCSICGEKCAVSGISIGSTYTYGCVCGRIYRLTRNSESDTSIEEDDVLMGIFSAKCFHSGIAVHLAWDEHKSAWITAGEESGEQRKALDQAMGQCWRLYRDEIIAHIKEMA